MARERRLTIFLTNDEYEVFNAVRELDLPPGTAARRILMDRANWLFNQGKSQRKPLRNTNPDQPQRQDYSHTEPYYDTSNSQS